ncbi:hypothetical protein SDRG_01461 [Saprolegnia diclina VS20]|uniref:Uncharacterized protein n=1 Tax=Saprolegnia diclina (strain VS20) TaxID=1156394 RepID=T0QTL6_SAPDV|nr:hypothetical protein SDRG_01461 [Saprolegnia diclina VS20]EQC41494.1 hypothetical protein SDRG_01461 [Saprolegnia diclina VS20]|eukprot:XP_008605208.1 hypothetical protein SDRG_01461 [Saprolegnia diclina VS20]
MTEALAGVRAVLSCVIAHQDATSFPAACFEERHSGMRWGSEVEALTIAKMATPCEYSMARVQIRRRRIDCTTYLAA